MQDIKPRYYSVKEIKELEHCGKDKAYAIAKELPHEKRGKDILVFSEDYEEYYRKKRERALNNTKQTNSNIYAIRKLGG